MSALAELAAGVMLGSQRGSPRLPVATGEVGELLATLSNSQDPAEALVLRGAGVLAACSAAGYEPPASTKPLPAPCEPETLQVADDPALVAALGLVLRDATPLLRREALGLLKVARRCLPPRLLPSALDLATSQPELRESMHPALGLRGRWLSRQRPEWSWADEPPDSSEAPNADHWDHGAPEQRRRYLERLRAIDPARARSLLAEALEQADARERANLLSSLEGSLERADEPLLEKRLADRGKEVRQIAGNLLARLPESGYARRMRERLASCLGSQRKLLSRTLTLEAPPAFPVDGKADAIEEARAKGESLGDRAWWLYQIARAVPLAWWTEKTGLAPADLLRWVRGTDWADAVLRGWREVQLRDGDPLWAAAFLSAGLKEFAPDTGALIAQMPRVQREAHWLRLLQNEKQVLAELLAHVVRVVQARNEGLSAECARRLLAEARKRLAKEPDPREYGLRQSLAEFAGVVPPEILGEAATGWSTQVEGDRPQQSPADSFLAVIALRQTLHRTLQPGKSS